MPGRSAPPIRRQRLWDASSARFNQAQKSRSLKAWRLSVKCSSSCSRAKMPKRASLPTPRSAKALSPDDKINISAIVWDCEPCKGSQSQTIAEIKWSICYVVCAYPPPQEYFVVDPGPAPAQYPLD